MIYIYIYINIIHIYVQYIKSIYKELDMTVLKKLSKTRF